MLFDFIHLKNVVIVTIKNSVSICIDTQVDVCDLYFDQEKEVNRLTDT